MDLLMVLIIVLRIAAPLCSIAFTYVRYHDSKKKCKKKAHQMLEHLTSQVQGVITPNLVFRGSSYTAVSFSITS